VVDGKSRLQAVGQILIYSYSKDFQHGLKSESGTGTGTQAACLPLCVAREANSLDARTPRSAVASCQLPSKSVGLWLHFSLFDIEWDICNRVLEFEFPWSPSSRPLPTPPTPTS